MTHKPSIVIPNLIGDPEEFAQRHRDRRDITRELITKGHKGTRRFENERNRKIQILDAFFSFPACKNPEFSKMNKILHNSFSKIRNLFVQDNYILYILLQKGLIMNETKKWLKEFCDEGYKVWKKMLRNKKTELGYLGEYEKRKTKKWKEAEHLVKDTMNIEMDYTSQLSKNSETAYDVWGVDLVHTQRKFVHIFLLQVKYSKTGKPKRLTEPELEDSKEYVKKLKKMYLKKFESKKNFPFKNKYPVIISGGYIGLTDVKGPWEIERIERISRYFHFNNLVSNHPTYRILNQYINRIHTKVEFRLTEY